MLNSDVITRMTYYNILHCIQCLKEELEHYYRYGKGNPPSSKKMLQRYGFKEKRKDKLIKAAEQYIKYVEVV
jgi:hypothetical protein